MRLVDGAEAIRQDLPSTDTRLIDVPLEAGDSEDTGILRWSSIRLVRERLQRALVELASPTIVIGGDCGVEYAGVEHATRSGRVILLWADAHADLNTPATSPSGAFHGMVLRSLIDDGVVAAADVLLLGARDLDDAEASFISDAAIRTVDAADVGAAIAERAEAARADGIEPVLYIHVDLDVLDPAVFGGVGFPAPFGLDVESLTTAIAAARAALTLAGAGVTEFAPTVNGENGENGGGQGLESAIEAVGPTTGDDLTTILRILSALSR